MSPTASGVGLHFLADYYGCSYAALNDAKRLREVLIEAVAKSGATILSDRFEIFQPHGVTGVVIVAESHVALHTWPERGFMAVDYFTCSSRLDPHVAFDILARALGSARLETRQVVRGAGVGEPAGEHPEPSIPRP